MNRSSNPAPPLVSARGLTKAYRSGEDRLSVLEGLDLEVARGEMLAVLGVSGIGKTTLLNVLGLMDRPDGGSYRLDGVDVLSLRDDERAGFRNRRCGFVFQAHHLLPELNAWENVALPLWIRAMDPSEARERAVALLERLDMGGRVDHRPPQLSGGERQRVALARAFAGGADLILADEPTGNLDPVTSDAVFTLFRDFHRDAGTTTVLVTHSRELSRRCDRIVRMERGRLTPLDGAPGSVDTPPA